MTRGPSAFRPPRHTPGVIALTSIVITAALLPGCRQSAPDDIINTEKSTQALVFVKAKAGETLNRSNAEGNLYKLQPISPDGEVTPLTNFKGASVSDPCVSFDGRSILFSMSPPEGGGRHIYEINADGSGLRQVTTGGGPDFDPLYLPDGNIMFTSSRDGEMDEYNHAPAEHLYLCAADGSGAHRVSFNQSDDFDPALLPDGRILYTRWEHFGTMNRFPLFFVNPDGTGAFHRFGPHNRNFFHAQPTPDGRIVAIESTEINGDAGPLALLKTEEGPADPALGGEEKHWDVLTPEVNMGGAPWPYGSFKYPFPLGRNRFVASYSLPAAETEEVDYGLYTFTLTQEGEGTAASPATLKLEDLTFLYNDPEMNEYDAQLLAPHPKPPVLASTVDESLDYGIFLAQDVFNRSTGDGQEVPVKGQDPITRIAVLAARPTAVGEMNDISANEFEKRAFIGFAPVQPDGSFRIKVPARTPISFATLDEHDRGFVVKRTWLYLQPGEQFTNCFGCHEDRHAGPPIATNPHPMAADLPPTDLNLKPEQFRVINFAEDIAPILRDKCVTCHTPTFVLKNPPPPLRRGQVGTSDAFSSAEYDTIPPAGGLDLRLVPPDSAHAGRTRMGNRHFPIGYLNLSGEGMVGASLGRPAVVEPAFPRHSLLIDYALGLGTQAGKPSHPEGEFALTADEKMTLNLWVLLGAQYR